MIEADWGIQGVLGLTYAFTDKLLLGVVYRSQADTDLEGDVRFEGLRNPQLAALLPNNVKISWTNPQWLEAGLRYRLDDETQLYANAGWQEWSKFSENEPQLPGRPRRGLGQELGRHVARGHCGGSSNQPKVRRIVRARL